MDQYNPLDPAGDPFGPPALSTLVACLHCGEEYDSYRIEWRVETHADGKPHGFWCCPIAGCDGMGFGFDIFPIDAEYRDEHGELMWVSDAEDEDSQDEDSDGDALFIDDVDASEPGEARRPTADDSDEPLTW